MKRPLLYLFIAILFILGLSDFVLTGRIEQIATGNVDRAVIEQMVLLSRVILVITGGLFFLVAYWLLRLARDRAAGYQEKYELLEKEYNQLAQGERLNLLKDLMAGIAHDLNNPLTVISGSADLLLLTLKDEDILRQVKNIRGGAARIHSIISNLLAFSRGQKPILQKASLPDVLQRSINLIQTDLFSDKITVEMKVPQDLPTLALDVQQIQQVLMNLVSNSRRAMREIDPPRSIVIEGRQEGDQVFLVFSDNGPGIMPEIKDRIFEPFFSTREIGTGLGLSLCKTFIEGHGGSMRLLDSPKGAVFEITLPVPHKETRYDDTK